MITIKNVSKHYGKKRSLQDVSLTVKKGEIFGLLGSNGAGKSTLLSILATISEPTAGEIMLDTLSLPKKKKQIREKIGYVPQDISLWEDITVKENMVLWSKFTKQRVSDKQLYDICCMVNLQEKWHEKVSNLSGGMKRKLNIAVALIHNPDILLMDEPTVGIDIQSKLEINHYIRELAQNGKTIVYTTHDVNEILFLCDKVGVLKEGVLQFSGTLDEARKKAVREGVKLSNDEELLYYLFDYKIKI